MERLNALTRDADEENVFWIDDEKMISSFFQRCCHFNPDFQSDLGEETTQTLPSFLRLHFELLFEVLLVEEEAAMRKLEEEFKANMMMKISPRDVFFAVFLPKKKISTTPQKNFQEREI